MQTAEANRASAYLQGNFAPVDDEIDVERLEVTGAIPPHLSGAFLRNGPNPVFDPLGDYHWFDGDGMLHRITLRDGVASYRNRWIATRGLAAERRAGRALYGGMSHYAPPDPALVGDEMMKNLANTNVVRHAGRILRLWEAGLPTRVTPDLATIGPFDFDGRLRGAMTPIRVPLSGRQVTSGSPRIIAPKSITAGASRKIAWRSVNVKSCIMTGFGRRIGTVWRSVPSAPTR